MRTLIAVAVIAAALSSPSAARSQDVTASVEIDVGAPMQPALPTADTPGPETSPPAEAGAPPVPELAPQPEAAPAVAPPAGQWIYTEQYGWIWMPYADSYTYVPQDGYGEPYAYVYYPAYGWMWVGAPWIWGWGPWPYFGVYGAVSFGWYGHGWWQHPSHFHYLPHHGHGGRHGFPTAPAPGRGSPRRFEPSRTFPAPAGGSGFRSTPAPAGGSGFRTAPAPGFRGPASGGTFRAPAGTFRGGSGGGGAFRPSAPAPARGGGGRR